ncbi:MAG: hypothetical protein A3H72_01750 [Candidatus Doudnabacteria bacterium RIFCSPLOWO2_02_FULL_48_8]|uniref:Uncharacterized protein n=1 Tax=Candidatus Doudnabacteria bacterium RIFCSPHIGHO2_01_FULL_46_24 TaxID=1817825 RepID=A0A1F5NVX6_9BACT|nr:MAG: hypothetical protein A2720_00285 [Candidatus Doudnabacteria bacterium RIFCSPHIGHO2_01_FULL_46_24]OGE94964.1 MAG: hypothetical protein A3H72_01750 [Candidatus Doudnabacteria bacterium RIFCSPLOWO2_02_FULL_48_8]
MRHEMDERSASELLMFADQARSPKHREGWLSAYASHDFSRVSQETQSQLAAVAELFRNLSPAKTR